MIMFWPGAVALQPVARAHARSTKEHAAGARDLFAVAQANA